MGYGSPPFYRPTNMMFGEVGGVLLPTGNEGRGVLWVRSIPAAILPSGQGTKTIALLLHKYECSWVVTMRNTSAGWGFPTHKGTSSQFNVSPEDRPFHTHS